MDYEEILNLIKENEKIQKKIINDPFLREKLYEKFFKMRNSGSDQTLPNSFSSSKYDDRWTQANTMKYRTPNKSDEGKEESPRFTQFSKSDIFGRGGTIYDKGEVIERNIRDTIDQNDFDNKISELIPHGEEKKDVSNFSFKQDKNKERRHESYMPNHSKNKISNAVKLDENVNELYSDYHFKNQQIYKLEHQEFPSIQTNEDPALNIHLDQTKNDDVNEHKVVYSKKSTDKDISTKEKINIENNNNQLLYDTIEGLNEHEPNKMDDKQIASVDRPITKRQTMKSLNNKFNDSQMPSKNSENLRNYVEHGIIRHQKSRSKYIYKKSDESEEVSASEGRQNEFVHKHKSEIDAYSVDQSRWNLSVREKLKKRSTKVRQKLMTSRDSIEKLDNEFSGMNKHYQTNQHEEDFKEQKSLEHINTPYYDQLTKKTQMQKVGDFKDKNRESMRSSRIRPRTDLKYDGSSSYSKSLKSDLIRRNVVEELKKRERRFNHLKYIDNNNSSNKEKEEDKVQQNTLKLDTDNREIAQAIEDIKQNSNKLENIMLIENKNLLVNTTHTASLKNDSELGLLGRIISD